MENSFFEYRDKTGFGSGSDSEIIDDSYVETATYSCKKKNHTVVPESEESTSNDESIKEDKLPEPKSHTRRSVAEGHIVCSSEDDSRRGSIRRPSQSDNNMVVSSSDEEDELSPELLPKRRPPRQSNDSIILRRTKKRMLFIESDTDNSLIIEQNKNKKQPCLKQTPLKIVSNKTNANESMHFGDVTSDADKSADCDKNHDSDGRESDGHDSDGHDSVHGKSEKDKHTEISRKYKKMVINSDDSTDESLDTSKEVNQQSNCSRTDNDHTGDQITGDDDELITDDEDDGPDEDMMAMSRATRMSIMGVIPKDDESDDSDFIRSEASSRNSKNSIAGSLEDLPEITINSSQQKSAESDDDLPEVSIHQSPKKVETEDDLPQVSTESPDKDESDDDLPEVTLHSTPEKTLELDDSRLSCSPFSNSIHNSINTVKSPNKTRTPKPKADTTAKVTDFMDLTINIPVKPRPFPSNTGVIDLSNIEPDIESHKVLDKSASVLTKKRATFEDDDVTIVDSKPEIIALSSDDEDEVKTKKSPRPKSPKSKPRVIDHDYDKENVNDLNSSYDSKPRDNTIKQYLVPASYPSQVKFVKKHVKDNEMEKLRRLQEDLASVRHLLQEMDMDHLPDGGSRLLQRLSSLEEEVRRQGDKVANMVEEPDDPSAADIARDGYNKGLSWDDIQKASNAVQPRMFGEQAMATHMAERNLILAALRDLHESLASRPPEGATAPAPRLLQSELMPHQLHALAWLQWRETQKPRAGILADDMGLGKTITMISLIAADKQSNIDPDDDEDESTARGKLVRGGTLVVCPASLLQQWAGEVGKHCAARALSVCLHHGAARASAPHRLTPYDVVATTYNILQRDNEKNGVLMRIQWRRIILDEAHIVRNHKAATSVAVSNLKGQRRWCLTGTPVQNKDLDLFALLKFMRCTPFDDIQMWKKWINNKSQGGEERLSTIMRCILLRRTKVQLQQKGQLACLPTKTPHMTEVTLNKDEMNVYQKVLVLSKTLFAQFLHQRAEKNSDYTSFSSTSRGKDSEYDKMHKKMVALQGVKPVKSHEILVLLLRLRQVCCHCGLIAAMLDQDAADVPPDAASSDLQRELDKLSLEDQDRRKSKNLSKEEDVNNAVSATADEAIRAVLSPNNPVFQLKRPSSKITEVMKCLNERVFANKGEKAVVVSQWTSVLRLVEHELNMKKIRSVTLSGNVPVPARPLLINAVNDPNNDVRVMLLSLCAGGVGINLCGANHLLLLDPHWNPQLEEQAQDRIYRVGQKKDVHIYRFMCVGTVEQTIRKLQEAKLQLAENVLTGARNTGASTLSIEDLKMLFNMGND